MCIRHLLGCQPSPFPGIGLPTTPCPWPMGTCKVFILTVFSLLIFIPFLGIQELRPKEIKLFPDSVKYPRNFLLLKEFQISFLILTVKRSQTDMNTHTHTCARAHVCAHTDVGFLL